MFPNNLKRILLVILLAGPIFLGLNLMQTRNDEASLIPGDKGIMLGKASWYSRYDPGIREHTANNEIFDDTELTCAMWEVPFNQKLRVTNLNNGKSIVVRVNDRGPHKRFVRQGRKIDLTKEAFRRISGTRDGIIPVQIEFL